MFSLRSVAYRSLKSVKPIHMNANALYSCSIQQRQFSWFGNMFGGKKEEGKKSEEKADK